MQAKQSWGLAGGAVALVVTGVVALTGCGDDDCTVTLTCPPTSQPSGGGGSVGGAGAGGQGGTTTSGGGSGGSGGQAPSYSAQAVDGGDAHTCALLTDGRIACWGNNDDGQLGDGTFTSSPSAVIVDVIDNAETIAVGARHSCAIRADKTLWCWGDNGNSQLGAFGADSGAPTQVAGLTNIGGVAAGVAHTCAFTIGGGAKCWGQNADGQLGGSPSLPVTSPRDVQGLSVVSAVAAGQSHSCAIADTMLVFCWGSSTYDQANSSTPTSISKLGTGLLPDSIVTTLDSGCALEAGVPYCWGRNNVGQLGLGHTNNSIPAMPPAITNVAQLAAGDNHACARLQNTEVSCWGNNASGQIGDASDGNNRLAPTTVPGLSGVTAIGLGGAHSCAVLSGGAIECWGANGAGQLGDGTGSDSNVPVAVTSFP